MKKVPTPIVVSLVTFALSTILSFIWISDKLNQRAIAIEGHQKTIGEWQKSAKAVLERKGAKLYDDNTAVSPTDLLKLVPQFQTKSSTNRYLMVLDTNERYITIHLKKRIADKDFHYANPEVLAMYGNKDPEVVRSIAEKLFSVHGIEVVGVHSYGVTIEKAELFQWNEMTNQIARIIEQFIPETPKPGA